MRDYYWINELSLHKEAGKVFYKNERIYWDMFFREGTRFLFQNYDVVKECIARLKPSEHRYKADRKPKCLTWLCNDYENCPFVLKIESFGKPTEKTVEELKKCVYWIRKAQNHDHSPEIIAEPRVCDKSMSKYYKLEKRYKMAEVKMNELADQLKKTTVKIRRYRIQEKIRNLRKKIRKLKADMEKMKGVRDQPNDDCAIHPSKEIGEG